MNRKMATPEDLETITLKQVVKDTLRNYFANIGGEQPIDFYNILFATFTDATQRKKTFQCAYIRPGKINRKHRIYF